MISEIKEFKRKDLFNHYNQRTNPFVIVTTKIDVTEVVNYCKEHKNFYATMGFIINKTANQIDAFKYRYKDENFYYCENVKTGFTQMINEDEIGFFTVPVINELKDYITEFLKIQKEFLSTGKRNIESDMDEIWVSCAPWFSFSSLIPPFDKEITIPQFIWDKYECVDGKYFVNLMVMVHHGFADGYHIGKFVNSLQENINQQFGGK